MVMQDGHTFFWSPDKGAWLLFAEGGGLRLDVVGNVPHFPTSGRSEAMQKLANEGLAGEVRLLESLSEEELQNRLADFRGLRAEVAEVLRNIKDAEMQSFIGSPAGLSLRTNILVGRRRLWGKAAQARVLQEGSRGESAGGHRVAERRRL